MKPEGHASSPPFVGAARSSQCIRTIDVVCRKLHLLSSLTGQRLLDVGCGDGAFTIPLGAGYDTVHGVDVQAAYVDQFRARVADNPKFQVELMSASRMRFADGYFDTLVSIETLEHIADLKGAIREFSRVLRRGGECLITCPNRWFPFENHGVRWRGREIARRIPLLTYIPPLHDRFSLARVFTASSLDHLFHAEGFTRAGLAYLWPTFEHGGNPAQRHLRRFYGLMRRLEESPLRFFGTSVVSRYVKPL